MNNIFTRDFFITNNYDPLIDQQLELIAFDNPIELKQFVSEILSIEDIFISLYLLQKIKPKCEFIDDSILELFANTIILYKTVKFPFINLNKLMNNLIRDSLSSCITIEVFINSLKNISLTDENIIYARKYFGYSQIYKFFKKIVETIYVKNICFHEIYLLLKLLDNYDLIPSLFSPVLKRTTSYVKNNIIDINIVQCVEVIKSVCLYDMTIFKDYPDYIPSLTSFVVQVFYDSENLEFISLSDADLILEGINIFLEKTSDNPRLKDITTGIFKQVYDKLKEFINRKTTVFEEYILIVCLLEILYIYFKFSYDHGSRMFDYNDIFTSIRDINIKFPDAIDKKNRKALISRFFERKYKILDALAPFIDSNTDFITILKNDLNDKGMCFNILNNIDNIFDFISWPEIIKFACVKENTEDFLEFIFNEKFTNSKDYDHCDFISPYIETLARSNNQDLLLMATKLFTLRYGDQYLTIKQINTLFELYLYNIESNIDSRVKRRRELVLNFMHYRANKDSIETLLSEFLSKIFEIDYLFPNVNILLPLFVLAKNNKNISEEKINEITKYILETISRQYDTIFIIDNGINLYIAVLSEILCFHNKEMYFSDDDFSTNTQSYFKIITGLICCIFKISSVEYLNKIKEYMLNYLFVAKEEEKKMLRVLIGHADPRYTEGASEKSELMEMCRFVNSRITIL